ncbi:MAG: homocysteine methyltransferase, partial [Treponema sp.]|nr:homocysteine methyltransferase [Treponema sp.]
MRKELSKMIGKERLFFDGGTGTVLQSYGIKPGELPENWNLTHADKIVNLHYEYFKAGANIVKTNSFGAYTLKFPLNLERIITSAIENANIARNKIEENSTNRKHFIAYDMTSSGKLLK